MSTDSYRPSYCDWLRLTRSESLPLLLLELSRFFCASRHKDVSSNNRVVVGVHEGVGVLCEWYIRAASSALSPSTQRTHLLFLLMIRPGRTRPGGRGLQVKHTCLGTVRLVEQSVHCRRFVAVGSRTIVAWNSGASTLSGACLRPFWLLSSWPTLPTFEFAQESAVKCARARAGVRTGTEAFGRGGGGGLACLRFRLGTSRRYSRRTYPERHPVHH